MIRKDGCTRRLWLLDGVVYVGLDDSYLYALDALVRG